MRGVRGSTLLLTVLLIAIAFALQGCPSLIANVVAPGQSIQQAIDQADPGDTIKIMGTHDEDIVIDKNNLTLKGQNEATIDGNVTVKADSDTLETLKITGMLDTPTGSFADLELDNVDLYDRTLNTTLSCTAVVNPDEDLQSVIEVLADGDTICLAPGVSTDGVAAAKKLTYIRIGSGEITIRPAASFTYSPENPQSGETITFDASSSVDPAGLKAQAIEQYDWSFGDGDSGSGETVTHSYGDDGNYEVTLTVTDDEGESNSTSKTVPVGNQAPNASFTADPNSGSAPLTVDFDAAASSDPDGTIQSYEWDFGNGNIGTGETVSHEYKSSGTFTATLTVTDDDNATNSISTTINVSQGSNVSAKKQDFTGDGTKDIRLVNNQIYVQLNGEHLPEQGRKPMLSEGGFNKDGNIAGSNLQNAYDVTGKVTTNPPSDIQDNGNLHPEFRSTEEFKIVTDRSDKAAFRIKRNYYIFGETSSDKIPMEIDVKVSLSQDDNFALLDITYRNEGNKSFTFDTDPGHIHDGTKVFAKNDLVGRDQNQSDYRFFLPGQGVRYVKNQYQWKTYTATEWVTIFDSEDAATYGVTEGPTSPKMWIISGDGRLTYFRQELTLSPGESATYTAVVGIHDGGSDAPATGEQIITEASTR